MKYARKYSTQITSKTTLFGLNFSYAHSTPGLFEPGLGILENDLIFFKTLGMGPEHDFLPSLNTYLWFVD